MSLIDREKLIAMISSKFPSLTTPDCSNLIDRDIFVAQEVFVDIINLINEQPEATEHKHGEWISVDDRLPDINTDVLVIFDSGNMAVGNWTERDEHISIWAINVDDGWCSVADCMPEYWMPLPEPPADMRKGE